MKKKLITWGLIALAGFWIFKEPANAANAVGGALGKVGDAADSAITFLTALFS